MGESARLHRNSSTLCAVDPLSSLIDAPRGRGAFLLRVPMARPWCLRVRDEAPLTVVAVTRGRGVLHPRARPAGAARASATCCWCAAPRRTTSATCPAASRSR